MSVTVIARGDSRTANNDEINVQNTNRTPVTELTFEATDGGDVTLDFANGGPDPDTVLIIDGVARTFTVEFSGDLPADRSFANVGGADLRGSELVVITDDLTGQRYIFLTDPALNDPAILANLPNGAVTLDNINYDDPIQICFAAGTLIDTPEGPRRIEAIRAGDLVTTDLGPVPVVWAGANHVGRDALAARPELRPVTIGPGALGRGMPSRPLVLSPDHRVVLQGARVEVMTGRPRVLCAAKFLEGPGIARDVPAGGVTWCHVLLPTHRLLRAEGAEAESLSTGARARVALGRAGAALDRLGLDGPVRPPLPILTAWEARALMGRGALLPH